jgi:hypothetical protein
LDVKFISDLIDKLEAAYNIEKCEESPERSAGPCSLPFTNHSPMGPALFGAAQVCDPFLQERLLVVLDACECDSHAHIGEDKCDFAERRECGVIVGDADANLRTLRCGIQHVEEASANTQVAGLGDELCVGRNLSYYCLCDEWVAWSLTAL